MKIHKNNNQIEKSIIKLKFLLSDFKLEKDLENNKKIDKYLKSVTHSSFANQNKMISYEGYEFLGDAILQFLVSDYLGKILNLESHEVEERVTKIRIKMIREESLANETRKIKLNEALILLNENDRQNNKICADIFESFVAAIYLNNNIFVVKKFLKKTLFRTFNENFVRSQTIDDSTDSKSKLQEKLQGGGGINANKINYNCKQNLKNKKWECNVSIESQIFGRGEGNTKKDAEQFAAEDALSKQIK